MVVDGLLAAHLIEGARADALTRLGHAAGGPGSFGSGGQMVFPSESRFLNEITLCPRLLAAVAQLLGCPVATMRLTQADLWLKRGRETSGDDPFDNADQRMHVDYPNHMLTHPPPWDEPDAVEMIVYMDDVDAAGGATAVVRRHGRDDPAYPWPIIATPGVGHFDWVNDRDAAETYVESVDPVVAAWRRDHLYAREEKVRYRPGTVLLYRHDTWHRGTPLRRGATRIVQNLTFRRAASEWVSTLHEGWAWAAYRPSHTLERLIATASVDQRCVLGFPPPASPFWTEDTVTAVEARYARFGIDMTPYRRS